jgi:hypothetical protein
MSLTVAALRELVACGLTPQQILKVAEAQSAAPSSSADRQRRYRERKAASDVTRDVTDVTPRDVTNERHSVTSPRAHVEDITSNLENSGKKKKNKTLVVDLEFEALWRAYPHRKGRSSKPKSAVAWRALPTPDKPRLLAAIQRYALEGYEPRADCGAKAFELWLRDQRYLDWLEDSQGPPPLTQAEKDADDQRILAEGALKIARLTAQIAKDSQFPVAGRNGGSLRDSLRG